MCAITNNDHSLLRFDVPAVGMYLIRVSNTLNSKSLVIR